jgi:hypothetical protein
MAVEDPKNRRFGDDWQEKDGNATHITFPLRSGSLVRKLQDTFPPKYGDIRCNWRSDGFPSCSSV